MVEDGGNRRGEIGEFKEDGPSGSGDAEKANKKNKCLLIVGTVGTLK